MKIVINKCYGGFGLSDEAHAFIAKRKGWKHACDDYDNDYWYDQNSNPVYSTDLARTDLDLIAAVEELGKNADGVFAYLKVINIPENVEWEITDYDGVEEVHEKHRSWS